MAAHIYAGDNQDAIPINDAYPDAWVLGDVSQLPGATNIAYIYASALWSYNKAAAIYQCPGDMDLVAGANQTRVRNYSLNGMMGNNEGLPGVHPSTPEHFKFGSITNPSPASASFFIDEQSSTTRATTSIDDGYFAVDDGTSGSYFTYNSKGWQNVPSSRHGNYGQFSYADGHAAIVRWLEPDTQKLQGVLVQSAEFNNRDKHQVWLTTYASGSIPGVPW
jgi:prepilin-type processing-associated H-X9-DG protein